VTRPAKAGGGCFGTRRLLSIPINDRKA